MLNGSILVGDQLVSFWSDTHLSKTHVSVYDTYKGTNEHYETDSSNFSKALAIAVHWEGTPNSEKDYPAAERAQGTIRWIP